MDRELPHKDEIWRHFKNKLYRIITVAQHTETDEQLVVYATSKYEIENGKIVAICLSNYLG